MRDEIRVRKGVGLLARGIFMQQYQKDYDYFNVIIFRLNLNKTVIRLAKFSFYLLILQIILKLPFMIA